MKITYTREESFYAHSKRHPMTMTMKTAATKDGKITAVEAYILGDTGAYASWAINVLRKAGVHVPGPYEVENVKVDSIAVYTNNPFCGAMRGLGPLKFQLHMNNKWTCLLGNWVWIPLTYDIKTALRRDQ